MTKELLRQALDALEAAIDYTDSEAWSPSVTRQCCLAIQSLEAAIEQPVPDDKDIEISNLLKQVSAYIKLTTSLDARIAELNKKRAKWQEAVDTLVSERQANAILTEQLETAIAQPAPYRIENAELVWPIAQDKWNAQADGYNKWDSLGRDEMSVLIVRETELQLAAIAQPAEPTGWPPGMLQDDSKGLSKWLSNTPNAKQDSRAAIAQPAANLLKSAREIGEKGSPHSEAERLLFEEYMRGHNWKCDSWNTDKAEYYDSSQRMFYAVFRDRAAIAQPVTP